MGIGDWELAGMTHGAYGKWVSKVLHILMTKFSSEFETINQRGIDTREWFIVGKGRASGLYEVKASPMYAAKTIVNHYTGRKFLSY